MQPLVKKSFFLIDIITDKQLLLYYLGQRGSFLILPTRINMFLLSCTHFLVLLINFGSTAIIYLFIYILAIDCIYSIFIINCNQTLYCARLLLL